MITTNALITTINVIFVFFLVVIFHEFGHFIVAKLSGIKVHEFAIGMGPKVFKYNHGETDYTIRLLPIGGFVKMEGEDELSEDERSFNNKPVLARMAVIVAGAVMNFILAFLLFSIVFYNVGNPSTTIEEVTKNQPAYESGILQGDEILSINNNSISDWEDIKNEIMKSKSDEITVTVKRNNNIIKFDVKTIAIDGRKMIGIVPTIEKSFIYGIKNGITQMRLMFSEMFKFFARLLKGNINKDEVGGPVKIVSLIGEASQYGFLLVLNLAAIISMNLGFFNLLPIPALDGSRLLFLFIELLRGKPIDPEKEGFIHFVGFIFLILLMIVVAYKDVLSL